MTEELKTKLKNLSYEDIKEATSIMLSSITSVDNWDRKLKKAEKEQIVLMSADEKKNELYNSLLKTSLLNFIKGEIDKAIKFDDDRVDYIYDSYMSNDASPSEKEHDRIVSDTFIAHTVKKTKKVLNQKHFIERFKNEPEIQNCVLDAIKNEALSFTAYTKLVSAINSEAKNRGYISEGEQLVTAEEMTSIGFTSTKELCPLTAYDVDDAEEL